MDEENQTIENQSLGEVGPAESIEEKPRPGIEFNLSPRTLGAFIEVAQMIHNDGTNLVQLLNALGEGEEVVIKLNTNSASTEND